MARVRPPQGGFAKEDSFAPLVYALEEFDPVGQRAAKAAIFRERTTVAVLRVHRAAQEAERAALGQEYHDNGYVFTCLNGDAMAPDRLSRTFRRLSDEAGLPPGPAARPAARRGHSRAGRRIEPEGRTGLVLSVTTMSAGTSRNVSGVGGRSVRQSGTEAPPHAR
jgi:hypothetical protein